MATGKEKTSDHIEGFKQEIENVSRSASSIFFNWFDESGGDVETNFLKGQCEFWMQIMLPLHTKLRNPKNQIALEIGCGGCRLLAAAAQVFNKVIGVDIHNNLPLVSTELQKQGITNFELIQNDGKTIPVPDQKIDFVYSYIVLQHVERIEIFNNYLKEVYRILKDDGCAILYYARFPRFSVNRRFKSLYLLDRLLGLIFGNRYIEKKERVNAVNLLIGDKYIERQANAIGFKIIARGVSRKMNDLEKYGGQHYVVLKKKH